ESRHFDTDQSSAGFEDLILGRCHVKFGHRFFIYQKNQGDVTMSLPLKNYHSYEHIVADLDRAEKFYCNVLGYKRIGKSTPEAVQNEGMQKLVLTAGPNINMILSSPVQEYSA